MSAKLHALLTGLSHTDFLARTESILLTMSNNPLFPEPYPEPFPSLANLKEVTDRYRELFHAASNGDRVKISQRNLVRTEAEQKFLCFASYITTKAGNDTYMLLSTGFDVRERATRSTNAAPLVAPLNVTVKHGELSGVLVIKASRQASAGSYDLQITEGDVSVEENWKPIGIYIHCSRIEVKDLEPGKKYTFRLRGIGAHGPGPWSAPVSLICM